MEKLLIVNSILLWVAVLFIFSLVVALTRKMNQGLSRDYDRDIEKLEHGKLAPRFTAALITGEAVNLESFAGRAIILFFLSPHCQPCLDLIPKLDTLKPTVGEFEADIVIVSSENQENTNTFIKDYDLKYPVLVAPRESNTFIKDYKATRTPWYCLVDPKGNVVDNGIALWPELQEKWAL